MLNSYLSGFNFVVAILELAKFRDAFAKMDGN